MQKGIKNQNIFTFSYSSRFQLSLDIYIAGHFPKSKKSRMDWFWVDPFLLGYGWIHHILSFLKKEMLPFHMYIVKLYLKKLNTLENAYSFALHRF